MTKDLRSPTTVAEQTKAAQLANLAIQEALNAANTRVKNPNITDSEDIKRLYTDAKLPQGNSR